MRLHTVMSISSEKVVLNNTEMQDTNGDRSSMSFEWCCKPVLGWMRFLGVNLQLSESQKDKTKCCLSFSWLSTIFGLMSFFVNVSFSTGLFGWTIAKCVVDPDPTSILLRQKTTSTKFWASLIDTFNRSFITVGAHFALLASTLVKWKDLTNVLHRMEQQQIFKLKNYHEFRKVCNWGLFFIILVGITF